MLVISHFISPNHSSRAAGGRSNDAGASARARLIARRVVGLPVGIDVLRVHCIDDAGKHHDGDVVYRAMDDGKTYEPR